MDIYTDGSCLGNPGPGGYGAVIKEGNKLTKLSGNEKNSTNNRMELTAIIEALKWVKKNKKSVENIKLYSDSNLIVQTLNKGWKKKANTDLWEKLDKLLPKLDIEFFWVKGHAENKYNNMCDEMAVSESKKIKIRETKTYVPKSKSKFTCNACGKTTEGILGYMPKSGLIRVDCKSCKKYIMFAPKTKENLARAKKRIIKKK